MKRLAYFIFLVFGLGNAQIVESNQPEIILPLLDDFKNECRKRELFIDGVIAKHLGSVEVVNEGVMHRLAPEYSPIPIGLTSRKIVRGLYGYVFVWPVIYLQDIAIPHPDALRWALYHELGHFFGLGHSEGIMDNEMDLTETYTEDEWDKMLDDLVDKLKELPEDSHWVKSDNTHY